MKTIEERLAKELMFFVKNPNKRCRDSQGCKYDGESLGLNTKGCLIGRMLPKKTRRLLDGTYGTLSIKSVLYDGEIRLPKWMHPHGDLLEEFQQLHDENFHWREGKWGGQRELKRIVEDFKLDPEPFKELLE